MADHSGDDKEKKTESANKSGLARVFDFEAERVKRGYPPTPKRYFAPGFQLISK